MIRAKSQEQSNTIYTVSGIKKSNSDYIAVVPNNIEIIYAIAYNMDESKQKRVRLFYNNGKDKQTLNNFKTNELNSLAIKINIGGLIQLNIASVEKNSFDVFIFYKLL